MLIYSLSNTKQPDFTMYMYNKSDFNSFLYFYFQNNHCKKKTTSIILYPYYTNIDAVNTKVKMTRKKIITVTAICVYM